MDRLLFCTFFFLDSLIFMMLLKHFGDDDMDIRYAMISVVAASCTMNVAVLFLVSRFGILGLPLALAVTTTIFGIVLSFAFGMALKRAIRLAGIFSIIHIAFAYTFPFAPL